MQRSVADAKEFIEFFGVESPQGRKNVGQWLAGDAFPGLESRVEILVVHRGRR